MAERTLRRRIVATLEDSGRDTPYLADANEPDPRYVGYGVRAPAMKQLIADYRDELNALPRESALRLATDLLDSGYGEQQTVALYLLNRFVEDFTPDRFDEVDLLFRKLHGWSKIYAYTGSFLRTLLTLHQEATLKLVADWNQDDELWLRRASVVLFTRKTAASGLYTDAALEFCERLKHDVEDMVRKGVGWCLKDLMKADRQRIIDYVIELRRQKISSTITLYALRDIKGEERGAILEAG